MKLCNRCLIEKSESEFYKDKWQSDGVTTRCKACIMSLRPAQEASRINNQRPSSGSKLCVSCFNIFSVSQFYSDPRQSDGLKSKCITCFLKQARDFARSNPRQLKKLYRRYPRKNLDSALKRSARNKIAYAIRSGKISKLPCEVCDNPNSQAHHDDYTKPLDVKWRCSKHHGILHRKYL